MLLILKRRLILRHIVENFRKFINEGQEDLNTQVAIKIAKSGLQDVALGLSDSDLKDLVVYVYEKEFDETGEGWDPYDEDLAQVRDVLTPSEEGEDSHIKEFKIGQAIGGDVVASNQIDKIRNFYKSYIKNIKRHLNFADKTLNVIEDLVDNVSGQPPGDTQMKMPRAMKSTSEVYAYLGSRLEKLDRIKSKLRGMQNK